jgi:hypothetical protein
MSQHDHTHDTGPAPRSGFLTSRAGLILIGFLAIAGLLLVYEHRAHIFVGNWFWIALLVLCMGMHHFMHGGRSGHGSHGRDADRNRKPNGERP